MRLLLEKFYNSIFSQDELLSRLDRNFERLQHQPLYASMYVDDAAIAVVIAAAGTYYPVGTGLLQGETYGLVYTATGSTLTVLVEGKYLINWSISMSAGNNDHISGTVMVNNVGSPTAEGQAHTPGAGDEVCVSGTTILNLKKGDVVTLCVENEADADDITVHAASFTIWMIKA